MRVSICRATQDIVVNANELKPALKRALDQVKKKVYASPAHRRGPWHRARFERSAAEANCANVELLK
jgi:hypothetical protein